MNGAVGRDDVDGTAAAKFISFAVDNARSLIFGAFLHGGVERLHVDNHAVGIARTRVILAQLFTMRPTQFRTQRVANRVSHGKLHQARTTPGHFLAVALVSINLLRKILNKGLLSWFCSA